MRLLLLAFSPRLAGRAAPIVFMGTVSLGAVAGLAFMPPDWSVFWSGVIGFCTAFVLILTLALPALLSAPEDVPRVSAAMFALGYLIALVVPVTGGFLWDRTGIPATAFLPAAVMALGMIVAPAALHPRPPRR